MSPSVFDLAAFRYVPGPSSLLAHPAGVLVPLDNPFDSQLITPQVRSDITSGAYSRDMISRLPDVLKAGDRVLVVGAGLGLLASLVAKSGLAKRIIAVEANPALIPRIRRIKALNNADQIETVLGVLGSGGRGTVPFYIGRDFRESSVAPGDGNWSGAIRVPCLDVDLIMAEERISVIICDVPEIASSLLARADLSAVERILVRIGDPVGECWQEGGLCAGLAARGFRPSSRTQDSHAAVFNRFERTASRPPCLCGSANRHARHCPGAAITGATALRDARRGNIRF